MEQTVQQLLATVRDLQTRLEQQTQQTQQLQQLAAQSQQQPSTTEVLQQFLTTQRQLDQQRHADLQQLLAQQRRERPTLVDSRGIGKPETFKSKEEDWRVFEVKLSRKLRGRSLPSSTRCSQVGS